MPIKRLKGRREALTVNSELYKKSIIQYLEKRGYFIFSSSDVESELPDLVFRHRLEQISNWMEIKATSVSLGEAEFLTQLGKYLCAFLIRSTQNRFRFWIASYKLTSSKKFVDVYVNFSKDRIKELVDKIHSLLDSDHKEIIHSAPFSDILLFFETTEIIEGDPFDLMISKEKISPSPSDEPTINEAEYAAKILTNYDLVEPIIEEHKGYANLFPVKLPESIFIATTPYTNPNDVFSDNPYVSFPPFVIEHKTLTTFDYIENSILKKCVNLHTKFELNTIDFIEEDENNINLMIKLINRWINQKRRAQNMWIDDRTKAYFYPKPRGSNRTIIKKWVTPKGINRRRKMTRPYYKDKTLNFWSHKSVNLRAVYYWGVFFIQIRPRWLFSEDGKTILEGEKADKLDRFFRKSNFNRNKNLFYDTLLWYDLLFKHTSQESSSTLIPFISNNTYHIEIESCLSLSLFRKPNSELDDDDEEDIDSIDIKTLNDFW